jgi:hypothetical protein
MRASKQSKAKQNKNTLHCVFPYNGNQEGLTFHDTQSDDRAL